MELCSLNFQLVTVNIIGATVEKHHQMFNRKGGQIHETVTTKMGPILNEQCNNEAMCRFSNYVIMKPYKSPMQRITKANFVYQTFVNEYSDVKKEIEYEHKAFETVPIRTKDICN